MQLCRIAFVAALGSAISLSATPATDFETRERVRIQAHFDSVLGELRARDVSPLTQTQRARRGRLVEVLSSYRSAGLFPHNYDRPGLVPTFIDPKTGVRCAVGHLVTVSGRGDIAERVAAADNHVYVVELAADTAFRHWLNDNGLTLAEAARIQVPYMGDGTRPGLDSKPANPYVGNAPAVALTVGAMGLTTWNAVRNLHGQKKILSIAGMAVGGLGIVGGNALLANGQASPGLARAAIWTGLASTVTGVATMLPIFRSDPNRLNVVPSVSVQSQQSTPQVGFTGHLRF
jgi:hypothetical protein